MCEAAVVELTHHHQHYQHSIHLLLAQPRGQTHSNYVRRVAHPLSSSPFILNINMFQSDIC